MGGSNFCILLLKNLNEKQLEPDLSRFNYFVHLLLQLNFLSSSLFSSVHNLYFALLTPVYTTNPEILHMLM